MKSFICFICVLICGCSLDSKNVGYYHDINLFKLEGIKELNQIFRHYPSIEIKSVSENEKIIKYLLNKEIQFEYSYKKEKKNWVSIKYINEEDGNYTHIEYIFPNEKIVKLKYEGKYDEVANNKIVSMSILTLDAEVIYYFSPKIYIKPDLFFDSDSLNNVFKIENIKFQKNGANTQITHTFDFLESKQKITEKTCYEGTFYSFFWWSYFGGGLKKIICK